MSYPHFLNLPKFFDPIFEDIQKVDVIIRNQLNSEVALVRTIGDYIINTGGKRVRPALVLTVARALGCCNSTSHCLLAAVVEFIHTATLIHDDVVDDSELRRGRGTANAVFGNAASVLVGDYLYSRAFEMVIASGSMRVMEILSQATTVIAEGEVLQLLNINNPNVSADRYLRVIRFKTAKLFEAAARAAAVLVSSSQEQEAAAAAYGQHIGTAFQLMDDLLDYSGDIQTMGKNVGSDLREGKPTLPLIRVMEVGTTEQRQLIYDAICYGKADFQAIIHAIHSTGALKYTWEAALAEVELARQALKSFPASIYYQSLLEFCNFTIDRRH